MPMRDYEELKDIDIPINIDIPSVQKAMGELCMTRMKIAEI